MARLWCGLACAFALSGNAWSSEYPLDEAARLAAEAAFADERDRLTRTYVDCLKTEQNRWVSTNYDSCRPTLDELAMYLPEALFSDIAACLQEGVLGSSLSGESGTCDWIHATYAREVTIGVRWP